MRDDALGDIERYGNRPEESIAEKHSAVPAQLVHLISGVRGCVCDVLVALLQGGRERRRREVTWIIRRDARRSLDGNIEIKPRHFHLILQRGDPRRVEQIRFLRLRNVVSPDVGDVLQILKNIRVEVREPVLEGYYFSLVEGEAASPVDRPEGPLCFRPVHHC